MGVLGTLGVVGAMGALSFLSLGVFSPVVVILIVVVHCASCCYHVYLVSSWKRGVGTWCWERCMDVILPVRGYRDIWWHWGWEIVVYEDGVWKVYWLEC